MKQRTLRKTLAAAALCMAAACAPSTDTAIEETQQRITDVDHSDVERQSIGNCWLYSQASWVESMSLEADPTSNLDISQSYWTYWHWFDQVTGFFPPSEIQTGGNQFTSNGIVLERGLMREADFVDADTLSEMSDRQAIALERINQALADGELSNATDEEVRQIFDDAWELSPEVRTQLDLAFGADARTTLRQGADLSGTSIVDPSDLTMKYTSNGQPVEATLVDAISEWNTVRYPRTSAARRDFLRRVQRALHDGQPVVITWDVDFNALENDPGDKQGSFNLETLQDAGAPGRQGGHMTVLEDYQAVTKEFGLLEAGVTLDPVADADKFAALLEEDTEIVFLRTKNSWGANRPDREFAPGFPGYHDLYMDYMNGPIPYCPSAEAPTNETCGGQTVPLREVMLPPGY